ncbi:MAG TPA: small basic family protein [Bacillales bacterium]|nr:small basic family protein [Bacillales bacterium]
MWLSLIGLLLGGALGMLANVDISNDFSPYVTTFVLAGFDTLFGGIRASLNETFSERSFLFDLVLNIAAASGLTFLGQQLGVDLYLAVVLVFGVRLFSHLAWIREFLVERWTSSKSGEN